MKVFPKLKFIGVCLAVVSLASPLSARTFTNKEGKKIKAEVHKVTKDKVTLKMRNGKRYTLDHTKFSQEDQEYLADLYKESLIIPRATSAEGLAKIAAWTKAQMGTQIGNGECWTLADQAYKTQGLDRPAIRKWGRVVDWTKEKILPGDVVEFESAHFEGAITGPNHTAIVAKKCKPRGKVVVYQQNVGGSKIVQLGKFNLKTLKKGKVIIYRYE